MAIGTVLDLSKPHLSTGQCLHHTSCRFYTVELPLHILFLNSVSPGLAQHIPFQQPGSTLKKKGLACHCHPQPEYTTRNAPNANAYIVVCNNHTNHMAAEPWSQPATAPLPMEEGLPCPLHLITCSVQQADSECLVNTECHFRAQEHRIYEVLATECLPC